MRLLVLGGTRFIGPAVVRRLVEQGHSVAVFHRGRTNANLPASVAHVLGDRKDLPSFATEFRRFSPEVVIDTIALTEREGGVVLTRMQYPTVARSPLPKGASTRLPTATWATSSSGTA